MLLKTKRIQKEQQEQLLKQFNELKKIYFLKCNELTQIEQSIKDYEEHFKKTKNSSRIKLKHNKSQKLIKL